MRLDGIEAGTRLVTVSGDVVELIELASDKDSARVRYVEVLGGANAVEGAEDTLTAGDIATFDDPTRFVGPGQTSSSAGG